MPIYQGCNDHGVQGGATKANPQVSRWILLFVWSKDIDCSKLHHDHAEYVGEPVADEGARYKPVGIYPADAVAKYQGNWQIEENIIPPRKGREHVANAYQGAAA